jgi:hypothetical protein
MLREKLSITSSIFRYISLPTVNLNLYTAVQALLFEFQTRVKSLSSAEYPFLWPQTPEDTTIPSECIYGTSASAEWGTGCGVLGGKDVELIGACETGSLDLIGTELREKVLVGGVTVDVLEELEIYDASSDSWR